MFDEESMPLAGAQVGLLPARLETVTRDNGGFEFVDLPAGTYQVMAMKLGYETTARSVVVEEGRETTVDLELKAIRVDEVYPQVIGPFNGFVTCAVSEPGISGVKSAVTRNCHNAAFGALFGPQTNVLAFQLEQENIWALMGEMRWSPTAYATSDQFSLFFTYQGGYGSNWWCQATGRSPVQFLYHVDDEKVDCSGRGSGNRVQSPPDPGQTLHVTAFQPFQTYNPNNPSSIGPPFVAFQQRYESIVTVFYGLDPVLPYTAFADG